MNLEKFTRRYDKTHLPNWGYYRELFVKTMPHGFIEQETDKSPYLRKWTSSDHVISLCEGDVSISEVRN